MITSFLYFLQLSSEVWLLAPLGAIGIWRWAAWLSRRTLATFYRPIHNDFSCPATVVTAVYAEDPALFRKALASWEANGVEKIIVAIQGEAEPCAQVAREFSKTEVILLAKPNKRRAVAEGVERCATDIVVLADSDSIWTPGVLAKLLMPFSDSSIGGVGTRQNMRPTGAGANVWERLADIFLDVRYADEVSATAQWGRAVSCLSGRTAAYRTVLLKRFRHEFLNETFNGKLCVSGDDKCYTALLLKNGFKTWSQLDARVYSTFQPTLRGFVAQRIRWSRNTYRSDLRAMKEGWVWRRHPYLAFVMFDKAIAPFARILGIGLLLAAALANHREIVALQVVWWHASRTIKILPHLRRKPESMALLPLFIGASIVTAFIKVYSLFTLDRHRWLTREAGFAGRVERASDGPSMSI